MFKKRDAQARAPGLDSRAESGAAGFGHNNVKLGPFLNLHAITPGYVMCIYHSLRIAAFPAQCSGGANGKQASGCPDACTRDQYSKVPS
jgi:hypothetical protein